jgi:hypothetical protein
MTDMCSCPTALPDAFDSEHPKGGISFGWAAALARPSAATFDHASVVGIG